MATFGRKKIILNWLYERLLAIRDILSETGSIYVHLDWHIGHYVKILMDEVFGEENFRNEIIWHYDIGTSSKNGFKKNMIQFLDIQKVMNIFIIKLLFLHIILIGII